MRKIVLVCSIIPLSFQAITMETNWNYQKVVDTSLRKQYYVSCKQDGLDNCHMRSFNQSIKLIIK